VVIERPLDGTAGVIDFEKPKTITFEVSD